MQKRNSLHKHKLAVIGDSMGQGFQNGGIYRTDLSFPAILSRCFVPAPRFDLPSFTAQTGIPINMEMIVRGLTEEFGDRITWNEYIPAARYLYRTLRRIKAYWEGPASASGKDQETPYHNQAIWGFAANDSWIMNEKLCRSFLQENRARYSVYNVLPDHAMYITGRLVLNPAFLPAFEEHSQLDNIRWLNEHGGIENLIVCIGHNNFVGAISALQIIYSEADELDSPHFKRRSTVYRPVHFEKEMRRLFEKVARLKIPRVFVPTYPYMTIPPLIRGVNRIQEGVHKGYFDYYTRFWIWDEDFDPEKNPHLTRDQAIELDQLVDRYNQIIRDLADEFGFHTVPVHRYVNAVARRRLGVEAVRPFPPEFIKALKRNEMTSHLVREDGKVSLSTDYLRVDSESRKIIQGGIFSLDGLHPTTIGYGLIANIYHKVMSEAGVRFGRDVDWDMIIKNDSLVTDPPYLLSELRIMMSFLSMGRRERITRTGQNLLQHLLELFSGKQ